MTAPRANPRPRARDYPTGEQRRGSSDEWVEMRPRMRAGRRWLTVVGVALSVGLISTLLVWRWIDHQINPPGPEGPEVEVTIARGATTTDIASALAQNDVIGNPTVFKLWLRRHEVPAFRAGIYTLKTRMDYDDVVAVLNGPARTPDTQRITIPPGLTIAQTKRQLLSRLPSFSEAELNAALADPQTALSFAPEGIASREGMFFPDTYNLDDRTIGDELDLLVRMRKETERVAGELDLGGRAANLGLSAWEVMIAASLIEREAKIDVDRPKIARVIYNRLNRGMKLEIDAAVLYAVGKATDTQQKLTNADLAVDNPYNTYRNIGLPPTPIAAPSRKSIEAALAPADGKWLWYVLTDKGGAHTFAENERDFVAARQICVREKLC